MIEEHHGARLRSLEDLLASAFDGAELRRWIRHTQPSEIVNALPGEQASLSALIHAAVGVLERRGRIDGAFFAALEEERERMSAAIAAVAELWLPTCAAPVGRRTHLLTLRAPIAGQLALVDEAEVSAAIRPDVVAGTLHMDLGEFVEVPEGWSRGRAHIHEQVQAYLAGLCASAEPAHLSVFGLAPIPWLIALGYSLSETVPARIFNRLRDPPTWSWERLPSHTDCWRQGRLYGADGASEGVIAVSASASVSLERIRRAIDVDDAAIYSVSIEKPRIDAVRSEGQLQSFARTYREVLRELEHRHPRLERIHLFVAAPVAVAIACGRCVLHSSAPPLVTYDYVRGTYERALVLEP